MTADVTNIACEYVRLVNNWINNLRFGTDCFSDEELDQVEADLFWSQTDCDYTICRKYPITESDCIVIKNCSFSLEDVSTPTTCGVIYLTPL